MSLPSHALRAIAAGDITLKEAHRAVGASRRDVLGRIALAVADLVAVSLATLGAVTAGEAALTPWALVLPVLFWVLAKMAGLYDRDEYVLNKTTLEEGPKLLSVAAIFSLIATGGAGSWSNGDVAPLLIWGVLTAGLVVARSAARLLVARITDPERVLVIGDPAATARLKRKFARNTALNAVVAGRLSPDPLAERLHDGGGLLGTLDDLPDVLEEYRIERVVVISTQASGEDLIGTLRLVKACGVKVGVLPPLLELIGSSAGFDDLGGEALLSMRRFGLSRSSQLLKRTFDVTASGVALVALGPMLAAIAVAVKLSSRGTVIFRQTRIGRDGCSFEMMKFRTMVVGAEERKHELLEYNEAPPLFKVANDPRITMVGRFLRRQSLDELPQLFNVLRGEMSIVGPRPLIAEEDRLFSGWQRNRSHVAPGITGPWQVLGSSRVPFEDMVTLDYLYCANWSLWIDIKIILRTIPAILSRRSGEYNEQPALRREL